MSEAFLGEKARADPIAGFDAVPASRGGTGSGLGRSVRESVRLRPEAVVAVILALLVVAGAYLRLANLGDLGFRWDEDLSSLAVRAILEKGIPELPSGMVYLRGGLFLYMMAASAHLLGFGELALRLPAALFGIALIPLAFAFGRALFGVRVGLVVAALITFSYWDIEFSRYARMYAPFTFFYVLTLHLLWKRHVGSESTVNTALSVASAVLAISFHQLGYTLVAAFFFPLVLRGPSEWKRPARWIHPVVGASAAAAFFFWWRDVMELYRNLPLAAPAETADAALPPGAIEAGEAAQSGAPWVLEQLPLLAALLDRAPLAAAAVAAVLVGGAAWIAIRAKTPPLERLVLVVIGACAALQLFNVALLAILALAFLKREGLPAFRRPDVVLATGLVALAFLVWLALSVGLGLGSEPGPRQAVRTLLDYPHFFVFWGYPNEWPLASAVAVVGGAWAFDRAARFTPAPSDLGDEAARSSAASRFLLLALATPLIANGLFDTAFELFRYNVPLDAFYFTFVALALVHGQDLIPARRIAAGSNRGLTARAAGTLVLLLFVVGFDLNPVRGWLVAHRDYVNEGTLYRVFGVERHADFKTPAAYVAEHAAPSDTVIVLDSREIFNYLGRVDYWLRTGSYDTQTYVRDGKLRDLYVATPLLTSVDALRDVLEAPDGTKWLIASDGMLAGSRALSADAARFILDQKERIVYVARDGDKKVYRFD